MATSLMAASQSLCLSIPNPYSNRPVLSSRYLNKPLLSFPKSTLSYPKFSHSHSPSLSLPQNPKPFILRVTKRRALSPITAATSTPSPYPPSQTPTRDPLTGSTRTLTTLFALAVAVLRKFSISILTLNSSLPQRLGPAVGPLFFAALRDRPRGYLNTPLTVVAAGLSKWLDIYSGVLMVRVLLSWFPNIPWDRQPLSAIRDLCDPYLNLFRNIIPPVFDTLDVSPLLAFAVLGTLGSILNSSRGMY